VSITTKLASITVLAFAVIAIVAAVGPWSPAPGPRHLSRPLQQVGRYTPPPTSTPALFTGVYGRDLSTLDREWRASLGLE
jgi:hypothetical protein